VDIYALTIFPELINDALNFSVLKRARERKLLNVTPVNIRDFSLNKNKRIDDAPYGGGPGMVMAAPPVYRAFLSVPKLPGTKTIYVTPQGRPLTQKIAEELSKEKQLVILCGRYEGIDERVIEEIVTDEISIGDYVLTGGELPALVLIDCVGRLIEGVLGSVESARDESFAASPKHSQSMLGRMENLLEYPQYTRPYEFLNKTVPDVLISGDHLKIEKWRERQRILRTAKKRPDLFLNGL
jgi:tRNA (guanine37-N1)-methyltransferase